MVTVPKYITVTALIIVAVIGAVVIIFLVDEPISKVIYEDSVTSEAQLQSVLDNCEENKLALELGLDINLIGYQWNNDTHYIDNNICEFQDIETGPDVPAYVKGNCFEATSPQPHPDTAWNLDECYWFLDDPFVPYYYEKYLDENNELNFGLPYHNGIIVDDYQRIIDYCNYPHEDLYDVFFSMANSTHTIDTDTCEWQKFFEDDFEIDYTEKFN